MQLGLEAADLARRMRRRDHKTIMPNQFAAIEAGTRRVRAAEVLDFCRELHVTPEWLLAVDLDEARTLAESMLEQPPPDLTD